MSPDLEDVISDDWNEVEIVGSREYTKSDASTQFEKHPSDDKKFVLEVEELRDPSTADNWKASLKIEEFGTTTVSATGERTAKTEHELGDGQFRNLNHMAKKVNEWMQNADV